MFQENSNWSNLEQKRLKIALENIFLQFLKIFIRCFWNWSQMKNNIVINISAQTLHLAKILYLELWDYRLSVNQIAGFFKVKILWTKWGLMLIFCFQISIKAFCKLILLSLVSLVQYAPIANQIAKFLEGHYLKKGLDGLYWFLS